MAHGTRATRATQTVALVGNPNSGKTTLFNALTRGNQRTGNWPGVTVEKKEGRLASAARFPAAAAGARVAGLSAGRDEIRLVDLPGIYALAAGAEDEAIARDYILSGEPALVVNIVDATNLQRNLFLTLQLLEMKVPVLVALNMMDRARKQGLRIDVEHLGRHLDCPVIPISATRAWDAERMAAALREALRARHVSACRVGYPAEIEERIDAWRPRLASLSAVIGADERWIGLKLIEGDRWVERRAAETSGLSTAEIRDTRASLGDELDVVLADARYGFLHGLSRHVSRPGPSRETLTDRVDRIVLNRFLALPIFLGVMYLTFWFTMSVGGAFVDFFDRLSGALFVDGPAGLLARAGAPAWLVALLAGGPGSGIRTVAAFVPVVLSLFLALALLEDSGYMARAAFVMDRFMRSIGLPGKSFVPMMVGFGCTVPAIMGTRTLESRRDRYMTIFMAPNMSCGARLPVYALFAAAFFPATAGAVVFSLYVVGIAVAILTGLLLKSTLCRGAASHFVMELPPYHGLRLAHIVSQALLRLKAFVRRAGTTIALIVTVLGVANSFGTDGTFGRADREDSVLSTAGRLLTPALAPMGIRPDNWQATVGLLAGTFAKEAVVGTLSSLYGQAQTRDYAGRFDLGRGIRAALATVPANLRRVGAGLIGPLGLAAASPADRADTGADPELFARMRARFSSSAAYAYLLFVLLYFPCVSALGAAIREMGTAFGLLQAAYLTAVAWSFATLFHQLAAGGRPLFFALALGLLAAIVGIFALVGRLTGRPVEEALQ